MLLLGSFTKSVILKYCTSLNEIDRFKNKFDDAWLAWFFSLLGLRFLVLIQFQSRLASGLTKCLSEALNYLLDARDLLRTWREDVVRRSDDVVEFWEAFIRDSLPQLGEEKWMILEQVGIRTHGFVFLLRRSGQA